MKQAVTYRVWMTMMLFVLMTAGMTSAEVLYFTDFSTNPVTDGWTGFVSDEWEWGSATASSGCNIVQDPDMDYSPSSDNLIIGYNIGGCYQQNLPETNLTSPAFDCTGFDHVFIDFYRFLGVERAIWDHASIRVSTNGSTWTTVWENTDSDIWDFLWTHKNYDISPLAVGQSMVYIRFVMGAISSPSIVDCGWNIDDFTLIGANLNGFLAGTVTDDMDAPIEGAVVTAIETGLTATTFANGTYNLPLLAGTYTITCEALGHNMSTASGVVLVVGATTSEDFVLTYPLAGFSPSSFSAELNPGETAEDHLYIENTGNGDLDFNIRFLPSTDRGPQAYYFQTKYPEEDIFCEIPNLAFPSTWNQVQRGHARTAGADFINNDFTTLYSIDSYYNTLRTIDTSTGNVTNSIHIYPVADHDWTGMTGTADGTMYLASSNFTYDSMLYTVDIGTGELTQIGTVINAPHLNGIAINVQGEMYGVNRSSNDSLVSINTSTGVATVIGYLGYNVYYHLGMDFDDATGTLYLAGLNEDTERDELWTIDHTTGATTFQGPITTGCAIGAFAITSPASWLTFDITDGPVIPGETMPVTLTFDAGQVDLPGLYSGNIIISHNSGNEQPVIIPVSMLVGGGPTSTPTTHPTATPTVTPSVTPTDPPTPTPTTQPPTNTPTPTPVECDWLGTHLEMSQTDPYQAGDEFWLMVNVCNNTGAAMMDVPTAVLLGVYGQYWFWPSWSMTFDYEIMDYEMGLTSFYALNPFTWPDVEGTVTNLEFYSALLTPEMNNIIGDFGYITFGYTD